MKKLDSKKLQMLGMGIGLVGFAISMMQKSIEDKQLEEVIDEKVNDRIKALNRGAEN